MRRSEYGADVGRGAKNRLTKWRGCGIIENKKGRRRFSGQPLTLVAFQTSRSDAAGRLASFLSKEDHQDDDQHHNAKDMYPTIASHRAFLLSATYRGSRERRG